jgi:hypothetical protein
MPFFRTFVETMSGLVPSVWRRVAPVVIDPVTQETTSANIYNLAIVLGYQLLDTLAQAVQEQAEVSWPLDTASGWVLDSHWGPYFNQARNGQNDTDYRLYLRAKKILNFTWGSADQALDLFALLLPTATLTWTPSYPKAWTINITGVDMATAAPAVLFMTKNPSPQGGGFSVCGDNGQAVISDPVVFSYSSLYEMSNMSVGWYSSVYGPSGGAEAGWAHVAGI